MKLTMDGYTRSKAHNPDHAAFDTWLQDQHLTDHYVYGLTFGEGHVQGVIVDCYKTNETGNRYVIFDEAAGERVPASETRTFTVTSMPPTFIYDYCTA